MVPVRDAAYDSATPAGREGSEPEFQQAVNAIGVGYLSRYRVTFDFHKPVMILEKGKWFDMRCPGNQAGVDLVASSGAVTARFVDENGPAWSAGLRAGDRIISIRDRDASHFRLDEIGDMLYRARGTIRMKVVDADGVNAREIELFQKALPLRGKPSERIINDD